MTIRIIDKPVRVSLGLHIGPLAYIFKAYDNWGVETLEKIRLHLATCEPNKIDNTDHCIHLIHGINPNHTDTNSSASISHNWQMISNRINTIYYTETSRDIIWVEGSAPEVGEPRFEFPWNLLLRDIKDKKGVLVHGGLACHNQEGLLFLAPPGGGKTTTLSSLPENWQLLSDDAALIWPASNNTWKASPLPAWGVIANPERNWHIPQMKLDQYCHLKGLLVLNKSSKLSLRMTSESFSLPHIFRALSEYPVMILAEATHTEYLFRTSADIARNMQSWELSLPRGADIWPHVISEALSQ